MRGLGPEAYAPGAQAGDSRHDRVCAHHLQTLRARKKLPGALRTNLLAAGNPITDDAESLKRTVQCPAGAPQ